MKTLAKKIKEKLNGKEFKIEFYNNEWTMSIYNNDEEEIQIKDSELRFVLSKLLGEKVKINEIDRYENLYINYEEPVYNSNEISVEIYGVEIQLSPETLEQFLHQINHLNEIVEDELLGYSQEIIHLQELNREYEWQRG